MPANEAEKKSQKYPTIPVMASTISATKKIYSLDPGDSDKKLLDRKRGNFHGKREKSNIKRMLEKIARRRRKQEDLHQRERS
ncbi:CFC_HP_G0068360.mRNA.1.CDS.1 [Saccharomyces cerevisiae]|nr:CFC_HP_G0068360.mRNA.1.CDS.1 [Saccharomyces cerevisiae]CAI6648910.1 CFC_HP_G0068360.mRNA.1.CDS.1 [Saccharomyces cerevisiae]